ncbi:2-isopropylmalate synthase [Terracidiphilus sp.]|uniref:2-isopropylmalate synthase n=1 Tax=Terracidiphilus sp. TaxID=1964191 RepID=UPI003C2872D1
MSSNRLRFLDTTLRDGEQAPGCSMNIDEKLRMAHALEELGVNVIEAGFAAASPGDFQAIQSISQEVRGPNIGSLARAKREDIEAAARALEKARRSRVHIVLSSSDIHLEYKLKISRSQALEQADAAVRLGCSMIDEVEFSPEDSTRSDPDFLCQMVATVIAAGATIINIPDTVGYSVPHEYAGIFTMLRARLPEVSGVTLSSHCHNDLGLAVANTLAAVSAGVQQVECTINGIGERAGNAALEEVAAAMQVRRDQYPCTHSLVLDRLFPISELLSEIIQFAPAPNKAVVGKNAFAHEAGIHQHGVMANPLTYEIMNPVAFGVPQRRMVLGKHSGRSALALRYRELGVSLEASELDAAYRRFTLLADRRKAIFDQDLLALIPADQLSQTQSV